jgi:hypothetical protein
MRWCKLGVNEKILNIIEVSESDCQDADGNFSKEVGLQFLENLYGSVYFVPVLPNSIGEPVINGRWDDENQVFISNQPYPSWTFNYSTGVWEAPSTRPEDHTDDDPYYWDEDTQAWLKK